MPRPKMMLKYWAPLFAWAVFIIFLSSISGEDLPQVDIRHIDKFFHFIEYSVLGWLMIRALRNSRPNAGIAALSAISILSIAAFGIFDEWHQAFVPGRVCDLSDLVVDLISSGLGIMLYLTVRLKK